MRCFTSWRDLTRTCLLGRRLAAATGRRSTVHWITGRREPVAETRCLTISFRSTLRISRRCSERCKGDATRQIMTLIGRQQRRRCIRIVTPYETESPDLVRFNRTSVESSRSICYSVEGHDRTLGTRQQPFAQRLEQQAERADRSNALDAGDAADDPFVGQQQVGLHPHGKRDNGIIGVAGPKWRPPCTASCAVASIRTPRRNRSSSWDSQGSSGGLSTSTRTTLGTMTSARERGGSAGAVAACPSKIGGLASAIAVKGIADPPTARPVRSSTSRPDRAA